MELANRRGVRSIQHDLANKNSDCAFVSHVSPRIWVRTPMHVDYHPTPTSVSWIVLSYSLRACPPNSQPVAEVPPDLSLTLHPFLKVISKYRIPSNASPIGKQRIPQFTRLPFSFGSFLCKSAVDNPPFWITIILQTSFYIYIYIYYR